SLYKTGGPVAATRSHLWTGRLIKSVDVAGSCGCVPVVLLYTIRRVFSFAAACRASVWIAADAHHELGEQTRCARSCVPRRDDATRGRLFSQFAAPDRIGTAAV